MFCPQCGSNQSDELNFCKLCGGNLQAVRQVLAVHDVGETFWDKTWVAEIFLSHDERIKRKEEIERQRGITPEMKRYTEIKAGVITSCVGIGLTIFLYLFMQGIILGGSVPADKAEILRRIWVVGVIPFMVGIGLLINGVVVSKRLVEVIRQGVAPGPNKLAQEMERPAALQSGGADQPIPAAGFSVTEEATKHLSGGRQRE
jgi:hypothetical protein